MSTIAMDFPNRGKCSVQVHSENNLLLHLCPYLTDLTYEKYLQDATDVTYNLQEFHVQSNFVLDNSNVILHTE